MRTCKYCHLEKIEWKTQYRCLDCYNVKNRSNSKRWRELYPDKATANDRKYAHKRRALCGVGEFNEGDWERLVAAYGAACMKCGATDNLSLDHVIPLSLWGEHSLRNAQILCHACNAAKRDRSCADYRPYLAFEEEGWESHIEIPVGLVPLAYAEAP